MKPTPRQAVALAGVIAVSLITGCSSPKNAAVFQAEKADKAAGISTPNIAEEGFIYGLPIVMNCDGHV